MWPTVNQPDPISLATVFITQTFNGTSLGTGTGIVIQTKKVPMLVTAAHVLTGRHPTNGEGLHKLKGLPNRISLNNFFGPLAIDIPLYEGGNVPEHDPPAFIRHDRAVVDLAVLALPPQSGRYAANTLHESLWRPPTYPDAQIPLSVASTCYVIGCPEGLTNHLSEDKVLPLWKTGHLANDPHFRFTNPKLGFKDEQVSLIDATTRPGMSGGPVFLIRTVPVEIWRAVAATAQLAVESARANRTGLSRISMPSMPRYEREHRLVGIYSGRTSETSDLGLVWKPVLIHELLTKALGTEW